VRQSRPDPRRASPTGRRPGWVALAVAAGLSAGIAVAAFLTLVWPADLVVLPVLAAWALILSALSAPQGWKRPGPVLLLVAISAFGVGSLAVGVLALLGP
jgi:hypothetical protein